MGVHFFFPPPFGPSLNVPYKTGPGQFPLTVGLCANQKFFPVSAALWAHDSVVLRRLPDFVSASLLLLSPFFDLPVESPSISG